MNAEFKGTKGNWELGTKKGCRIGIFNANNIQFVDVWKLGECATLELKANALLISKAPEMLEMLKKCKEAFENLNQPFISSDIEQLIKEATEL